MKTKLLLMLAVCFSLAACNSEGSPRAQKTESGVSQAKATVKVQASGMTLEQENIVRSYDVDNKPGAIKHLYVISPYSGQALIYSTVKGKVTSSKKSINPTLVSNADGDQVASTFSGFPVTIHNRLVVTGQVMQESGTYGDSDPYIYWWDVQGRYHKHFVTGGQILHISDQPLAIKNVVINMELASK